MSERKSNSLEARLAVSLATNNCLKMICEARRLEVRALLRHLRALTGKDAGYFATNDNVSKWTKALDRARKFLKHYDSPTKRAAK